jgi:hypothetical protein
MDRHQTWTLYNIFISMYKYISRTHVGCRLANKPYTMDPKELGDFQVPSLG